MNTQEITLRRPDDWHVHLRDGEVLRAVAPASAGQFARSVVMPNLVPPVTDSRAAERYRERILASLEAGVDFEPLMTLYLTETSDPDDYRSAFAAGIVTAAKLYPAGATTNSDAGVKNLEKIHPVLEAMETIQMPLLVHGEVVDDDIDIFDREAVFIERVLVPMRQRFPGLKIVFEHITTRQAVDYILADDSGRLAATITPHHLAINRNALLVGGIRPHNYCLPVAKREQHRRALVEAAVSGDARFFLGTDSAPHAVQAKESACGCAGIYNVPVTLPLLATLFERERALDRLEAFTSVNGPRFYHLPVNEESVRLRKLADPLPIPADLDIGGDRVRVFEPPFPLYWELVPS